ncbi:hypothetical protein ACRRTK_016924 [Alexandromys fortis]
MRVDLWEGGGGDFLILIPDATHSRSHWATGLAKYSVSKETQVVSPEPYGNDGDLFRKSKLFKSERRAVPSEAFSPLPVQQADGVLSGHLCEHPSSQVTFLQAYALLFQPITRADLGPVCVCQARQNGRREPLRLTWSGEEQASHAATLPRNAFPGTIIQEVKFPSSHLSFAELAIPDQLDAGVLCVCQLLIFCFYSKAAKIHRRAGRREEPRGGLEKRECGIPAQRRLPAPRTITVVRSRYSLSLPPCQGTLRDPEQCGTVGKMIKKCAIRFGSQTSPVGNGANEGRHGGDSDMTQPRNGVGVLQEFLESIHFSVNQTSTDAVISTCCCAVRSADACCPGYNMGFVLRVKQPAQGLQILWTPGYWSEILPWDRSLLSLVHSLQHLDRSNSHVANFWFYSPAGSVGVRLMSGVSDLWVSARSKGLDFSPYSEDCSFLPLVKGRGQRSWGGLDVIKGTKGERTSLLLSPGECLTMRDTLVVIDRNKMQRDIFVGSPLTAAPSNQSPWEQPASQLGLDRMPHSMENLKCIISYLGCGRKLHRSHGLDATQTSLGTLITPVKGEAAPGMWNIHVGVPERPGMGEAVEDIEIQEHYPSATPTDGAAPVFNRPAFKQFYHVSHGRSLEKQEMQMEGGVSIAIVGDKITKTISAYKGTIQQAESIWEHRAIAIYRERGEKRSQTALCSASVHQCIVRTQKKSCKQTPDLYVVGAAPRKYKRLHGYLQNEQK